MFIFLKPHSVSHAVTCSSPLSSSSYSSSALTHLCPSAEPLMRWNAASEAAVTGSSSAPLYMLAVGAASSVQISYNNICRAYDVIMRNGFNLIKKIFSNFVLAIELLM